MAAARRMTKDDETPLTRETGFHPRTSGLARDLTDYRGFWLANTYSDVMEEYWACRERVAIIDLSALRKFEVLGPDAETLMNTTLTRDVRRLATGQVIYSALCNEAGGMIGDGTLFRLGPDNFRWIGGGERDGVWLRQQAEALGLRVWIKPSTDLLHNVAVQGPKSRQVLQDVVWAPPAQPSLAELGRFRFTVGRLHDFDGRSVVVSRTGTTGGLGYEVWCHPKDAVIGFTVALETKGEDFLGREALIRRKEEPQRVLVGLELDGNEPVARGAAVFSGPDPVGVITSATRSPVLEQTVALCRMGAAHGASGTEVEVVEAVEVGPADDKRKRRPARVVALPFYDPGNRRRRA
jgi:aminomethyltransferase